MSNRHVFIFGMVVFALATTPSTVEKRFESSLFILWNVRFFNDTYCVRFYDAPNQVK
ncbi:MAG: hypothetical protein ABL865_01380 [Candidatus Nitrotoga sp.]